MGSQISIIQILHIQRDFSLILGTRFSVVFGWFGAGLGRVWFGYWFGAVLRSVTNPNDS